MSGRGPAGGTGTVLRWTVKATVRADACPGEAARVQAAWNCGGVRFGQVQRVAPEVRLHGPCRACQVAE